MEQAELSGELGETIPLETIPHPLASSTPGFHYRPVLADSADAESTIDQAFAGIQIPDQDLEKPDLLKRLEEQWIDLQRSQAENATLRAQVRGYELIASKYHSDTRKYRKKKGVWIETERRCTEEIHRLKAQVNEKEQQLRVAVHAIKTNDKQIGDLTEEQDHRDTQHQQDIQSLNKLLKETEEITQQQIDGLNAEIVKTQQDKITAEYAVVEIRADLEEVKGKLSEAQTECQQAWDEIEEFKEQPSRAETTRGELIDKITSLYNQLEDRYFQIDYLRST